MDVDTVVGCVVIVAALGLIGGLVLWSRRAIERIARNDRGSSAREIMKDLRGER